MFAHVEKEPDDELFFAGVRTLSERADEGFDTRFFGRGFVRG